ncbi:MAG TPA: acylase, partial [Candidatus Hydrogenedentes bacterium]|nr:acylase [Candidatus Hydrogenedentota bacterium]
MQSSFRPKLSLFSVICCALLLPACPPDLERLAAYVPPEGRYDVTILRDEFGVPHIYGKTDPDVAYGLAYAHCEDDFATMQEVLLTTRGELATVQGFKGLVTDFLVRAMKIHEFVDAGYETQLSEEVRALCDAYADGANHYAALHTHEVLAPDLFPVTGRDVVGGFAFRMPFFYMLHRHLRPLMPMRRQGVSTHARHTGAGSPLFDDTRERGSNAFAVAPSRSADGYTRLAVNSHQPWTGPVAWYEARLHSEDGWDIVGGLFPGTPVVLHGHNRHLGWAHTVNLPDLCDLYELTINPENRDQYLFDGQWRDFEKKDARMRLKVFGRLTLPVKRQLLWSVHGPVMRTPNGVFAIAYAGFGEIRAVEQFYRMNRASTFEEFRDAMAMRATLAMNTVYADQEGNIWYLYNALFPVRAEGYDWSGTLPGDTSDTRWKTFWPFEDLPQVLNPPSGFVQNCNSDPFQTTFGEGNPLPERFPDWLGIPEQMTNRAVRLHELFGPDEAVTREAFYRYKFDWDYSRQSHVGELIVRLTAGAPYDDPLMNEAVALLEKWDFTAAPDRVGTAVAVLTGEPVVRAILLGGT